MIIILLGAPGAGKSTQAEMIVKHFDMRHLSTGDLLRTAASAGTEFGNLAREYMEAGKLLPDDAILGVIDDYLRQHGADLVLFDGVPRTVGQAEGLDRLLQDRAVSTVALTVSDEVVIERLSSRRVCSRCGKVFNPALGIMPNGTNCSDCGGEIYQRDDDKAETIAHRLNVYHDQTEPIIKYYSNRDCLVEVDGMGTPDDVFERVKEAIS